MFNFSALWKFFFDFSSCDSLHDSLVTAYLMGREQELPVRLRGQPPLVAQEPRDLGHGRAERRRHPVTVEVLMTA